MEEGQCFSFKAGVNLKETSSKGKDENTIGIPNNTTTTSKTGARFEGTVDIKLEPAGGWRNPPDQLGRRRASNREGEAPGLKGKSLHRGKISALKSQVTNNGASSKEHPR